MRECVSCSCRLYLLSWLHVNMHHLLDFIWSMLSVLLTRSMCYINSCNEGFRRIRTRRSTARPLLIFDFSSGYLLPIDYFSLRPLGGSSCSWGFSTSLFYLVVLDLLFLGVLYFFIMSFWKFHCLRGDLFVDLCVSCGRDLSCFTFRDFNFEMSRRGVTEW